MYGTVEDPDAALADFKRLEMEDVMVGSKVRAKRLNEEVRERLDRGDELPAGVSWYENVGINIARKGQTETTP